MTTKLKNKKGFTLIETMFGLAIFLLIVLALTLFTRNIWTYGAYISTGLTEANNGRLSLKTMIYEIRGASTANTGAYIIALASATAFTFYSDIDNDGLIDRVRYFLNGTLLQKGVTKPAGSPLTYDSANEKISTLIPNVTNSNIFDYYDKNYDGTSAPLSSPVSIPAIRLVKIRINIAANTSGAPVTSTFSTQVSIRNLKDNL